MKLLVGLAFMVGIAFAAEWSYEGNTGVNSWASRTGTSCTSDPNSRQSPINIPESLTYQSFDPFVLTGYDNMVTSSIDLELINNGHTAQINLVNSSDYGHAYVTGGGLDGQYNAIQLHFHWGRDDTEGSEHTFRGHQYPLEMHIVHYKDSYGDVSTAIGNSDGLAVLGFFFSTTDVTEDNTALDPLISALENVINKDDAHAVSLDFSALMGSTDDFYRYDGSLTTPECNEVVVWTVMDKKVEISSAQLAKFRALRDKNNIVINWNYRPTIDLPSDGSRPVYKNYNSDLPSYYHWGYYGAENDESWPLYYGTCSGDRQSPINIPPLKDPSLAAFNASMLLDTLTFNNYDQDMTGTLLNNGHTIQFNVDSPSVYIQDGNLPGKYIAAQFHLHWGESNAMGSEHTFEGTHYPLELHIVHYKESYGSLGGALAYDDGLAVVGYFFQVQSETNTGFSSLITALDDVKYKGAEKAISNMNFATLGLPGIDNDTETDVAFYRYYGGLTTPPCSEIVIWSVMSARIGISNAQLSKFREMSMMTESEATGLPVADITPIGKNYRRVQNIGDRKVFSSYNYNLSAASDVLPNLVVLSVVIVMGFLFK
ncbi:Carbonic anhydrase [Mactra antiquata]